MSTPIQSLVEGAGSVSARLRDVCDRYAEIIRRARIEQRFTEAEINALREACAGLSFTPARAIDGVILASFKEALKEALAERHGIDADATAKKLRKLSYVEQVALIELLRRQGASPA